MNSKELACTDDTTAYLVAGRRLFGYFSDDTFGELSDRLVEVATELTEPLVVIPVGNFSGTGMTISEKGWLSCVVGLVVASTDTLHISAATEEDLGAAVARAQALPWQRIAELVPASRTDEPPTLHAELALYATATGPLAGVRVGYGVVVELRAEDEDFDIDVDEEERFLEDPDSVAAVVPDLDLVRGRLMDQVPQPNGVYGVQVARALYDEPEPTPVDISADAHAARVAELGELSAQSAYHLIAHYD